MNVKRIEYATAEHAPAILESPDYVSETDENHWVAVNIKLTDELRNEGLARELVRRVQNLRKEAGFDVADRIRLNYTATAGMAQAIQAFSDYIQQEVLAPELRPVEEPGEKTKEFQISGEKVKVTVTRIQSK